MMNINERRALYFKRLTDSVESLGILLSYKESNEDLEELVVLAKKRRLSLCFMAFINYGIARAGVAQDVPHELDYDDALDMLFERGIVAAGDQNFVEGFYDMYLDMSTYEPLVCSNEQEMLDHIPFAYDYLLHFISHESRHL